MSIRLHKMLRRFLWVAIFASTVIGLIAFFCDGAVEFRLPAASRDGSEVWILCGFENGLFALGYRILPKVLDDALFHWQQTIPRWHAARAGRLMLVWTSPHQDRQWWFRADADTYQMQLPIPRPTTKPATAPAVTYSARVVYFEIPSWFLWLLAGLYPIYRLIDFPNQRRRKRFAAGECLACGYDLRHTPDRCPECGRVPASAPPPRGALPRLGPLGNLRRGIWVRIVLYPVFYICFSVVLSLAYLRHYNK